MSIEKHDASVPHTGVGSDLAEEPIGNPGLPAHTWRPTDVDDGAAKRAERQVAAMFVGAMVCSVLFVVVYFTAEIGDNQDVFLGLGASNLGLGLTLGGALLLIGVGVIQWARKLMADHELVEMRHPAKSSEEDVATTVAALSAGAEESGIGRRPLIRNTMIGALGMLGLPAVVALRDLGPRPATRSTPPSGPRACASRATCSAPRSRSPTWRSAT